MTLREELAAMAMRELVGHGYPKDIAKSAVAYADALIKELEETEEDS